MKITSLRLVGLKTINLPIYNALPNDPYRFKKATGMGPSGVDVSLIKAMNLGQIYKGRRPQGREIVVTIGLNPNYSVGQTPDDLRTDLYGLLTPASGDLISVQFLNEDVVVAVTNGTVSKFETEHFSKDPEVQITIPCLEAYLQAPQLTSVPLPIDKARPVIENIGTAAVGMVMNLTFTSDITGWTVVDQSGKVMQILYPFKVGDQLEVNTNPGERRLTLKRGNTTVNVLPYLVRGSEWLQLYGGGNRLETSSQNFIWNSFIFRAQYLGV